VVLEPLFGRFSPHFVTLVAQVGAAPATYALLAANVPLDSPRDIHAGSFYLSQGGNLTTYAQRLLYGEPSNASRPEFDGFGLPTNWVPPTDPTLFQPSTSGQDAVGYYLAQAQTAGQQATAAVQQAFMDLTQEAMDAAAKTAAQTKSQLLNQQAAVALCGPNNPGCETGLANPPVPVATVNLPVCSMASGGDTNNAMNCIARMLLQVATTPLPVAQAVQDHINDTTPPAFIEYTGGSLQAQFIQQWQAIQDVKSAVTTVQDGLTAALQNAAAADAAYEATKNTTIYDCTAGMATAAAGGFSGTVGVFTASASYSLGPLMAQINKCSTDAIGIDKAHQDAIAAADNAILSLAQQGTAVNDAVAKVAELSSAIQQAATAAQQAEAQATTDQNIANMSLVTGFGVYREYHSYDLWRAQAMVDNARRYAVAARRAIEAKYLVDLSSMTADEAFVAAPSTWADQVYDYDLSLPAAVGLTVGAPDGTGVYPNKVEDYIGNLQAFVNGYAVSRPTASASGDSNVITLLGPDTVLPGSASQGVAGPNNTLQQSWSYYCPASAMWVQGSMSKKAAQACTAPDAPSIARLVFNLDAWGRVDANGVQAPPTQTFNARWARLTVNLVGTGIKDCTLAADALGCYSSSFVRYNLTHIGPSWITGFDGEWRTLDIPVGQINQGKALVAEQWLDPVSNGWAQPYVQAVQRLEFTGQPLDGTYQLDIQLAPEVQLGKIERIQILSDTEYWVRQAAMH
jgi:hypothetical protein